MNNDFHSQSELWAFYGNLIGVLALEKIWDSNACTNYFNETLQINRVPIKRIQSSSLTESASLCFLKTPVSSDLLTVLETS
jgi:hypothetical protein